MHISTIINRGYIAKNPLYIIVKNWKKITGDIIFKVAYPARIKAGTLVVGVKNHSWLQELNMSKHLMIENIKKFTTEVDDVQFILDTTKKKN